MLASFPNVPKTQRPKPMKIDFGEQHQVLGSYYYLRFGSICTSSLHLMLFSEVGRRRFEHSRT